MGEDKKCCCRSTKPLFKYLFGLIFVILGVLAIARWWPYVLLLAKACAGPFLVLVGVIALIIAKE